MTTTTISHVRCDRPTCTATHHYATTEMVERLAAAEHAGWQHDQDGRDWCPRHANHRPRGARP